MAIRTIDLTNKKKKKQQDKPYTEKLQSSIRTIDIGPVKNTKNTATASRSGDIAPVGTTQRDSYFQKGALSNGITLKNLSDANKATKKDMTEDATIGILGLAERVWDGLVQYSASNAYYVAESYNKTADPTLSEMNKRIYEQSKKEAAEYVAKDIIKEEEIARKIITEPFEKRTGINVEQASYLGSKGDALVQSASEQLARSGLHFVPVVGTALATGVTGLSVLGGEAENAYKNGATYEEALISGMMSATGEMASEALFGGIKLGGKTVTDAFIKNVAQKAPTKFLGTLAKWGFNTAGEGAEEIISGYITALGQHLTYMDEKEINELFTKEDAWESFVAGSILGGFFETGNLAAAKVKDVDYLTGNTINEQKVIDKVVENRIAEQEADGTKLNNREKAKIEEEVKYYLEKGYIDTDTIESVLGGETYESYKSLTEKEKALQDEIKALASDPKPAAQRRVEAAKAELEKIQNGTEKTELKNRLSEEVKSLAMSDRLAESYNEQVRKTQAFNADLSQYDEKMQTTVKKAVESGILNNSNRTHEFVDMIAKLSADKGVSFDFTDNENLKKSGFALDGKTINGLVKGNEVILNVDSHKALNSVVGHEITHVLEGTELYAELQSAIKEYATTKGEYDARLKEITALYEGVEGANIEAEITADLIGDYLFTDSDFISKLSTEKPNIFKKIFEEIKYLVKVATAGSKEAKELEKVKRAFEKAYSESGNVSEDAKYSIAEAPSGKKYVNADVDQMLFDRLDESNKRAMAKMVIQEYFPAGTEIELDGETFYVSNRTPKEFAYAEKNRGKKRLQQDKMRTSTELDNLIKASNFVEHTPYEEVKDRHPEAINGIDTYEVVYKVQDRWYRGIINIINREEGREIYDVTKIKSISANEILNNENELAAQTDAFYNPNIPQNGKKASGNENIQYSISDSDGKQLTKEQQEYFKDSKVRDENGSLKVMYHGTPNGDFTVFKDGTYFTENKEYADVYQSPSASSISTGKVASNPKTFEVYLDIKKPFDINDPEARDIYINEYIKGGNASGINPYLSDAEYAKIKTVDWTEGEDLRDFLIENEYDYDGLILDEGATGGYGDEVVSRGQSYVVFSPEQVKNIDNTKPTSDPDIHMSLGDRNKPYGNYNVYGKDVRIQKDVAPMPEISESTDQRFSMSEDVEPAENRSYFVDSYAPLTTEQAEDRDNRTSSEHFFLDDISPEVEEQYDGTFAPHNVPADPFFERDIREVGNRSIKAYMYENPEVKPFFQEYANYMLGELYNSSKGERTYNDKLYYDTNGEMGFFGTTRFTSEDIAYLLDEFNYTYKDIEKGLKAIIEDNGKENNAISKRIEFLLDERLRKGYKEFIFNGRIPPNQEYINLLNSKEITQYNDESWNNWLRGLSEEDINTYFRADRNAGEMEGLQQEYAPIIPETPTEVKESENVAPTPEYEAIRPKPETGKPKLIRVKEDGGVGGGGQTARVLTEEPKAEKKKNRFWSQAAELVLDKGFVFENLAKKTKNRELEAKWNFIRYADGKAQDFIGNGANGVKSLKDVQSDVEKAGLTKPLYEYVYHLHNIDRMSLVKRARAQEKQLFKENPLLEKLSKSDEVKDIEKKLEDWSYQINLHDILNNDSLQKKIDTFYSEEKRAESAKDLQVKLFELLKLRRVQNKPVFGSSVTAKASKETAAQLEAKHPELKKFANEIYSINNYLRNLLVEGGVISQETADLWEEMYPHYVPIRRAGDHGLNINVPLDTRKTGINAPIKQATGGNQDILPLFDTMAQRALQTYKAVARNRFGVELKNALGTTIAAEKASVDSVNEGLDNSDELLKKGKNGKLPTFTVFENGERVTFEITEDMYDALKPTSETLKYTNKVANAVSNLHRNVLTQYNPAFLASNAIKDVQDVLINSQHPVKTYAAFPKAMWEMTRNGKLYQEYVKNGGEQNTYFDRYENFFVKEKSGLSKAIGLPLELISKANNFVEKMPRLAEYIASREAGRSIEVSMLDSARVTTNFAAGGDLTKFANRNGATFLNASVQGAMQQVRNVREAKMNGLKGWTQLATKYAIAGLPAILLNGLLWDDDEEYEELSDYVKENYYVVAKFDDGKFVRIPKGRTLAVIQNAFEQTMNALTGNDEVDLKNFLQLAVSNLAPNNPIENNIIAPIIQAKNNETWYGGDLVPTRLQDLPAEEQFDESTDTISRWLGEKLNMSPYKINYLLDQYTGGVGDIALPMLTPEAENGEDTLIGNITAPIRDKFTTDSVLKNQNVSDFYDTSDTLTTNAKRSGATDEDILSNKYFNSVKTDIGKLYAEKREIQNSDMSDSEKYYLVRDIQKKINALAQEALSEHENVNINGVYSTVGDRQYRRTDEGWQKLSVDDIEKQDNVTRGLGITPSEYWSNKEEYNYAYEEPGKYAIAKTVGGYDSYKTYSKALNDIKADKDSSGKTINGSAKEKKLNYINNLNIDYGQKLLLIRSEFTSQKDKDAYNADIIEYLYSRYDLSNEERIEILKELDMTVHADGYISW